ncbi:gustatory and odorant receptor 24-like [Schistocerca nitens]|uniref:gustatory and odorant receptor 24-like n=1 Tax=Schistocerca nitens TaxID=7011 RepID=UPI0021174B98|nr:gustatory and odorant receptor 24-like [Schistocerca nitens]
MRAPAWIYHSRVGSIVLFDDAGRRRKKADTLGVFASDLNPSFTLMRALGLLPIEGLQTASPAFRPTSGAFLYSLGCYLAVSGLAAFVAFYLITHRDFNDGSVYMTAALASLVPSFLLHPFYWFGAKKVVALLKKWVEFQETYLRTTGTQLNLRLRRPSMFFTVVVPLFTFLVVIAETFIFDIAHPSVAVAYTVTISMLVNHGVVWLLQCTAICRSSLLMKNYLRSVSCLSKLLSV